MDWTTIASFAAGLVSGFTLKIIIDVQVRRSSRDSSVNARHGGVAQSNNRAGGDLIVGDKAGRDVNKRD